MSCLHWYLFPESMYIADAVSMYATIGRMQSCCEPSPPEGRAFFGCQEEIQVLWSNVRTGGDEAVRDNEFERQPMGTLYLGLVTKTRGVRTWVSSRSFKKVAITAYRLI